MTKRQESISIVGLGYLGSVVAQKLENDFSITGSTKSSKPLLENTKVININLDNPLENDEFWKSDYIIIALPPSKLTDYTLSIRNIIGISSKKSTLIFISSISVYGPQQGRVDEKSLTRGKEVLVKAESYILESVNNSTILRLGGIVGPSRQPWKYLEGRSISNDEYLHLVHVEDCVSAIENVIRKKPKSKVYNIVNSQRVLKSEFYSKKCSTPPHYGELTKNAKIISNQKSIDELDIQYSLFL